MGTSVIRTKLLSYQRCWKNQIESCILMNQEGKRNEDEDLTENKVWLRSLLRMIVKSKKT